MLNGGKGKKKKFGKKDDGKPPNNETSESKDEDTHKAKSEVLAVSTKSKTSSRGKNGKKLVYPFAKAVLEKGAMALREEFKANPRIAKFAEMPTFMKNNATGRNRYKDVGCVEDTRVKLKDSENDYIHANYVSTPASDKRFICTQAPLEKTCVDFWNMIVQEDVEVIIMLCNIYEKQKVGDAKKKCHDYYPTDADQKLTFEPYTITCKRSKPLKMKIKTDTVIKETILEVDVSGKKKRRVKHYHWVDWPDRDTPQPDMAMFKMLENCKNTKVPVVVHCSAGVGRTGVVVLVQQMLDTLENGIELPSSLVEPLKELRKQRNNSVQTESQYFFTHMVLLNYLFEQGLLDPSVIAPLEKFRADYISILSMTKQNPGAAK